MSDSNCCGKCNFFKEGELVSTIGKCFITSEIKKADEYCTKTNYFRKKDQKENH
ncbi:hypothetical protein SAMN05446037_100144 [Anaerovirgula multivorans]|uniref:Uncharacterized protein n=1 Tax=Anaerovirgula multivorans TaxID=312168 RepID=A0A238ZRC2_9FIRM|nr:hypothetical protein [Anaerovirgula multivorans]SNR85692.1 hypothetical protein SAMN05446037_100144 [Anaerovirgula multivorans]